MSVEGNLAVALVRPVEVRPVYTVRFVGAIRWLPIYTLRFIGPVFSFKGKGHHERGPYFLLNKSVPDRTDESYIVTGLLKARASFSTNEES